MQQLIAACRQDSDAERMRETVEPPARASEPEKFNGLLPHLDLARLARHGHWKFVYDMDVSRDFVVGELAGGEGAQRVGVEWTSPRPHPDPRTDLFTVFLVRYAYDLGVFDVGV